MKLLVHTIYTCIYTYVYLDNMYDTYFHKWFNGNVIKCRGCGLWNEIE